MQKVVEDSTSQQPKTPISYFHRRSAIYSSSGKVRSPFKSPQRSPVSPKDIPKSEEKASDLASEISDENTEPIVPYKRRKRAIFFSPRKDANSETALVLGPVYNSNFPEGFRLQLETEENTRIADIQLDEGGLIQIAVAAKQPQKLQEAAYHKPIDSNNNDTIKSFAPQDELVFCPSANDKHASLPEGAVDLEINSSTSVELLDCLSLGDKSVAKAERRECFKEGDKTQDQLCQTKTLSQPTEAESIVEISESIVTDEKKANIASIRDIILPRTTADQSVLCRVVFHQAYIFLVKHRILKLKKMDVPNFGASDVAFLQEIDNLVAQELESIGYRDLVNKKFQEMNADVELNVTPKMKTTQEVFDELIKDVDQLEADEKILSTELNSLIAADVIVLDDDDDDDVIVVNSETPDKLGEAPQPTAQLSRPVPGSQSTPVKLRPMKPKPRPEVDSLGLYIGLRVLAKKRSEWYPATIIDIVTQDNKRRYKVRYDMNKGKSKVLPNHLACLDTPQRYMPGQISTGSRIVAHFKNEGIYSGIVAEAPDRKLNRGRFLIFFDDGYAMYCALNTVYLVYGPLANVWEDISFRQTADYIKEYLSTTERPMLALKINQVLKVEFQGEWHKARCAKVDASLVEVMYLSDSSREWVYRGSLRLEPLFKQSHMKIKAMQKKSQRKLARAHTGVRKAHIEYATIDLTRDSSPSPSNSPTREFESRHEADERKKNVGKKSTGGVPKNQPYFQNAQQNYGRSDHRWKAPWERSNFVPKFNIKTSPVTPLPQSYTEFRGGIDIASHILDRISMSSKTPQNLGRRTGKIGRGVRSSSADADSNIAGFDDKSHMKMDVDSKKGFFGARSPGYYMMIPKQSAMYTEHLCRQKCVASFKFDKKKLKGVNPLMRPLLLGWTREVCRKYPCGRGSSFHIFYRTPCGRMCRNMGDIDRFLVETGSADIDYDQFCFDYNIRTNSNISVRSRDAKIFIEDYSEGKEDVPIPCVNEINEEKPPKMPYTKKRVPGVGVKINTDKNFMVCCDCPDNCRDHERCPCQQLTVAATSCSKGSKIRPDAGYSYKRLYNFLPTGIYECNPQCKCNKNCPNRVVQNGLQCRLQMFKTHKKGWGIRCLDDIARGTFVCVYTGKIQNEEQADKEGRECGDEYLAELDHIEVAERQKDVEDGGSSSGIDSDMDDDDDDDDKNGNGDKNKRNDSGANTTDSDLGEEEDGMKHVTVTLKRAPDSKWIVKSNVPSSVSNEEKTAGKVTDSKRESGNGKRRKHKSAGNDPDSSDSDVGGAAFPAKLAPPIGDNDDDDDADDDDETTDTDTDFSDNENSRPPSSGPPRSKNQSFGLHSSTMNSDDKLSSDEEERVSQTRKYFGCPDTFVIDAKQTGNLGRYLNHSCAPNLLVQNIFIDTHDLRFPWVAFFASSMIRAGTELTWDYNYEIGSVEGRQIICYCGATKCRKRLL